MTSTRWRISSGRVRDGFGAAFVPVRKAGKLPWAVAREEYQLEYGTDKLEVHADAIKPGQNVLVHDDLLATGGTAAAKAELVHSVGATVAGFAFLIELDFLHGRDKLQGHDLFTLIHY